MPNMSLQKHPMPEQQPDIRATNFKEVALGYTREIAMEEADRCLHCKNAPCVKGCPVNVPIPDFIAHIKKGEFQEAYETIRLGRTAFRRSAAASARRKRSAKASASAVSRANRSLLAVWNALRRIMP